MPDNTENPVSSGEKSFSVKRSAAGINSIGTYSDGGNENVITLTAQHNLLTENLFVSLVLLVNFQMD